MPSQKMIELAARLEHAHHLTHSQRVTLLRDLERYAARDLYGAARLCKDHLSKDADLRLPRAIQVAPLLAKHFEQRMTEQRRAVDLHYEQDRQLRQPDPKREYVGPVVGTTPNCVIQLDRETGDLIVHPRASLVCAFESAEKDNDLAIRYPQAAIGGVGLVTRTEPIAELTSGLGLEHQAAAKPEQSMERGL